MHSPALSTANRRKNEVLPMIEAYAFIAMFTVQILSISVLLPTFFVKYVRRQATRYPGDIERFAQFYPGVDLSVAREHFLIRFRATNIVIAVLGLSLLGWLNNYMQRPNWDEGVVVAAVCAYSVIGWLPLCLTAWFGARFKAKVLEHSSPDARRRATLHRRGLLDFVSPFVVALAALGYLLFAAYAIYAEQHASNFPGFKPWLGFALLATLTLTYALSALVVYKTLYGKKINPIETRPGHLRTISRSVKSSVYSCAAGSAFFLILFTLMLLDLDRWQPFALSASLVTSAFIALMGMTVRPRESDADGLGPTPAH